MIGVNRITSLKTFPLFPVPRSTITNIPTPPSPDDGSQMLDRESFPVPVAAKGPDYSVGDSYYPVWHPNVLAEGKVLVTASNYGQAGSYAKWGPANGSYNGSDGETPDSTGKVRSIGWDPGPLPGFDPRIPAWNVLPFGSANNARIQSVKARTQYGNSVQQQNVAGPLIYSAPQVASLQAGLFGN